MVSGARAIALLAWLALAATQDTDDIVIGVADVEPNRAELMVAVVQAAGARALLENVEPGEPLQLARAACALAESDAAAALLVDGGGGGAAARAGLPLLLGSEAPAAAAAGARQWDALAVQPGERVLGAAAAALCQEKGWRSAVLLHEGGRGGARRAALLAPDDERLRLTARTLPPPAPHDPAPLRNLLLVLKKARADKFVVWCDAACCSRVLTAAQQAGLLAERQAWLLLAPDLHTEPLHGFSHGGANVTVLLLFDPGAPEMTALAERVREKLQARLPQDGRLLRALVPAALPGALLQAHAAVRRAGSALRHLRLPPAAGGRCARGAGGLHADTLLNYLRSEEEEEERLRVAELQRGGVLEMVGSWTRGEGVRWQRAGAPAGPAPATMANRTFTVLLARNKPYVMIRESDARLAGNDRYEGFCVELIQKLAELLEFNYTFVEETSGDYGKWDNVTDSWSGMLGRLLKDPVDTFAITDLTITAEREKAVDFTTPFMNLGISILYHTPDKPVPETFAFLLPFSPGVWMWLGVAYVGTSLVLFMVGRLCPAEWTNPHPCVEDPPALDNQFTLHNALWFNLGAVLLQGSEIAPMAYGTRAVAGVWWVFALVVTSSYTANLATLLAKKSSQPEITGVQDLWPNELGISYGAKANGATLTFFEKSNNTLYKNLYEVMKTQKMPGDNDQGIEMVAAGKYAFFMESTTIEYTVERRCEVQKVGGLLDNKGYGIAMVKQSPYRQALNLALLKLQEAGVLRDMKHKWWKEMHGGGACDGEEDFESEELRMANFRGLFMVLGVGCALGAAGSLAALLWRARAAPPTRYWRRVGQELRFVCSGRSVRPARVPPDSEPESPEPEPESAPAAEPPASPPLSGRATPRRRSSMAAASARLARHATLDSAARRARQHRPS